MKKRKAKKTTIPLRLIGEDDRDNQITGYTRGDYAYHKTVGNPRFFTITHLPSGRAVKSNIRTSQGAWELVCLLDSKMSQTWDGSKEVPPPNFIAAIGWVMADYK